MKIKTIIITIKGENLDDLHIEVHNLQTNTTKIITDKKAYEIIAGYNEKGYKITAMDNHYLIGASYVMSKEV